MSYYLGSIFERKRIKRFKKEESKIWTLNIKNYLYTKQPSIRINNLKYDQKINFNQKFKP